MADNGHSNGNGAKPALKVTSAREWRKLRNEGVILELPSGMVAKLRPVSLIDLWSAKRIPDSLTGLVANLLAPGGTSTIPSNDKMIEALADLYKIICTAAFLAPTIADNPQDDADEIAMEDLVHEDREFVLAWAQAPSAELKTFRSQSPGDVAIVEPVASVPPTTKRTT